MSQQNIKTMLTLDFNQPVKNLYGVTMMMERPSSSDPSKLEKAPLSVGGLLIEMLMQAFRGTENVADHIMATKLCLAIHSDMQKNSPTALTSKEHVFLEKAVKLVAKNFGSMEIYTAMHFLGFDDAENDVSKNSKED